MAAEARVSRFRGLPRALSPAPLAARAAAILAVPLVLYALYATGLKALDNYRLNQQADALSAEVRALRQENLDLQQALEAARTDAAIEAIAREQLGLVKPGDNAVVLLPEASGRGIYTSSPAPAPPLAPAPAPPTWRQWWDHFFGPTGPLP